MSDGFAILDKLMKEVLSEMCLLSRGVDEVKGQTLRIFKVKVFSERLTMSKDSEMGMHKEARVAGEEQAQRKQ